MMSKPVTVYTITKAEVMTEYDHLSIARRLPTQRESHIARMSEDYAVLRVENIQMRVKEFSESHYEQIGGILPCQDIPIKTHRSYIAVEPDLEKYLRIEWDKELDEIACRHRIQENHLTEKLVSMEQEFLLTESKVKQWWAMPWYKRTWSAIKGGSNS